MSTKYIEVYGTMPEAREYIAEEFNLPVLPPPVSLRPPQDIRSGPIRTITYYPMEGWAGLGGAAAICVCSGFVAFAITSIVLR